MTDTPKHWDLTFVIRISAVNEMLSKVDLPDSFDPPPDKDGLAADVTGKIAAWRIVSKVPGGIDKSGSQSSEVIFEMTLTDVAISGGLLHDGDTKIAKVRAYISMPLVYEKKRMDEVTHQLKVADLPPLDDNGKTVFAFSLNGDDFKTQEEQEAIPSLRVALSRWAEANPSAFATVLAEIDVFENQTSATGSWAQATAVDYTLAVASDGSLENSVLCVLAMTGNRTPPDDADRAAVAALPHGTDSAIHIAGAVYLDNVVRPALAGLADTGTPDMFKLDATEPSVSLKSGQQLALGDRNVGPNDQTGDNDQPSPCFISAVTARFLADALEVRTTIQLDVKQHVMSDDFIGLPGKERLKVTDYIADFCTVTNTATDVMIPKIKTDAAGITRISVDRDAARSDAGTPQSVPAPSGPAKQVAMWFLNIMSMIITFVVPPVGIAGLIATNTIFQVAGVIQGKSVQAQGDNVKDMDVNLLVEAIGHRWAGFDGFDVSDAAYSDGMSLVGKLRPKKS